ncbi:hypothetical protein AYO22_01253 [Fonsecaea multimorphosa]|nr:hypothetical protein AYO22_01253 [Fonsecaea multimorphosa]
MPLLDVDELHSTITVRPTVAGVAKGTRVSLLLVQALLFATSPFLADSTLQTLGYDSGAAAQRAFYQRAELLYSHNTEKDPVAILQSLLLMSYRVRTPDNEKSAIYWSRLAATHAQTTDITGMIKRSSEGRYRSLLRRLWWCCLLRESLVGLGSRLPTILSTDSESPSPLTAEDFPSSTDINLHSTFAPQNSGGDVAYTGGVDRSQGRKDICTIQLITIELSRLSVWISKLLSIDRSTAALVGLVPCISGQEDQKIDCWRRLVEKTCAAGLKEWLNALPAEARFSTAEVTGSTPSACVTANRIMLYMVFQAAASFLYRRQAVHAASLVDSPITCSPKDPLRHAARRLRRAAQEIASASKIMIGQGLTKYMQPHGVSVMLSSISVLLVDVRDRSKAANAAVAVRTCLDVLQAMARNHDGVQRVYEAFAPLIEHTFAQLAPREHDEDFVHGNGNGEDLHHPFSATPVPDTQTLDFHDPWNVGWPWDSFQPGEIHHQNEALLGFDISVGGSNPGQGFENIPDLWFPDDGAEGNLIRHDEFLF